MAITNPKSHITVELLSRFYEDLKAEGLVAKATSDAKGNTIDTTYAKQSDLTHVKNYLGDKTEAANSASSASAFAQIKALWGTVSSQITLKVIPQNDSLPSIFDNYESDDADEAARAPQPNTIYLVLHKHDLAAAGAAGGEGTNVYDEYIFIPGDGSADDGSGSEKPTYGTYELIGNTDINLSAYLKTPTDANGNVTAIGSDTTPVYFDKTSKSFKAITSYSGKANTAGTADKAVSDGNGANIASTYLTKTDAGNTYLGKTAKAASAGSADTATTATNLENAPALAKGTTNTNAIKVTAGGKSSAEFTVPYASAAGSASSATNATTAATANALASKSVGSKTTPVYIDAQGKPVACDAMQVATSADIDNIFG